MGFYSSVYLLVEVVACCLLLLVGLQRVGLATPGNIPLGSSIKVGTFATSSLGLVDTCLVGRSICTNIKVIGHGGRSQAIQRRSHM